jgi:hypothetical protein
MNSNEQYRRALSQGMTPCEAEQEVAEAEEYERVERDMEARVGVPAGFKPVEVYLEGVMLNIATAGEAIFVGDLLTIVDQTATRGVLSISDPALVAAQSAAKGDKVQYYVEQQGRQP